MAHDIKDLGYFCDRDSATVKIRRGGGEDTEYTILKWNEFDSTRKCASVVVRGPDGRVFAYVKGSDSAILNMLAP